jgi:hypothetical protein
MFIDLATQIINADTTCKRGYSTHSEVSNTSSMLELCPLRNKIQQWSQQNLSAIKLKM